MALDPSSIMKLMLFLFFALSIQLSGAKELSLPPEVAAMCPQALHELAGHEQTWTWASAQEIVLAVCAEIHQRCGTQPENMCSNQPSGCCAVCQVWTDDDGQQGSCLGSELTAAEPIPTGGWKLTYSNGDNVDADHGRSVVLNLLCGGDSALSAFEFIQAPEDPKPAKGQPYVYQVNAHSNLVCKREGLPILTWLYALKIPSQRLWPSDLLRHVLPNTITNEYLWCGVLMFWLMIVAILTWVVLFIITLFNACTGCCSVPHRFYSTSQRYAAKFLLFVLSLGLIVLCAAGLWSSVGLLSTGRDLVYSTMDTLQSSLVALNKLQFNNSSLDINITFPPEIDQFAQAFQNVQATMHSDQFTQQMNLELIVGPVVPFSVTALFAFLFLIGGIKGRKAMIGFAVFFAFLLLALFGGLSVVGDFGSLVVADGCTVGYLEQFEEIATELSSPGSCAVQSVDYFFACKNYNNQTCQDPFQLLESNITTAVNLVNLAVQSGQITPAEGQQATDLLNAVLTSTVAFANCTPTADGFTSTTAQLCGPVAQYLTLTSGISTTIFAFLFILGLTGLFAMNRVVSREHAYATYEPLHEGINANPHLPVECGCGSFLYSLFVWTAFCALVAIWVLIAVFGYK